MEFSYFCQQREKYEKILNLRRDINCHCFSVQNKDKDVLEKLKSLQGERVKLTYIERYGTFAWLGDTKYFVKDVEKLNPREDP